MTCLNFKSTKSDQYRKGGKKKHLFFYIRSYNKAHLCKWYIFFVAKIDSWSPKFIEWILFVYKILNEPTNFLNLRINNAYLKL